VTTSADLWDEEERRFEQRLDAQVLFELVKRKHEVHLGALRKAERALVFALRRVQRERRHAARATHLLEATCSLVSKVRA
jgi:hypothetical protein